LGNLVADSLIQKARGGVEVRVIYDDVGCWNVPHRFFEQMREEGIEVVPFLPVRFPSFTSKVNYRNHRKLIVIDGRTGFMGGMNIAKRYVSDSWRDTMVGITGLGVYTLQRAFLIDWYFVDRTLLSDRKYYPAPLNLPQQGALVQLVTGSPVVPYPEIMQGFVRTILAAKRYIYIETPYFLPTESVFFALKTAAATGIDVRIIVPFKNDSWFVEWAGRSYLREAVEAGIKVSLYQDGFLHSKLMVCDDSITTCGSTNIDFRSFENNCEANLFFYSEETALRMKHVFTEDEQHTVLLKSLRERMKPRFIVRLFEGIVRMLAPLM
jgi:cardiolipin synthase